MRFSDYFKMAVGFGFFDDGDFLSHPGPERFVANKGLTAIRQPYDSLVEPLFSAAFGFVLAIC